MAQLRDTKLFYDASLVSYYKLDDTSDSKGSNTLTNNNVVTFSAGKYNNAATFTAASSQSLTRANGLVTSGSFSFGCWVKFTSLPSSGAFMSMLTQSNAGVYSNFLLLQNNAGTYQIYGFIINGASSDANQTVITPVTGVWYHVVQVYDGANHYVYWNGVLAKQDVYSAGYNVPNQFNIGKSGDASNWYLDGQIDDAFAFNRALTPLDIWLLYVNPGLLPMFR